jgi:four helix bundle protein
MTGQWTHKDLELWRLALTLAELVSGATKTFPSEDRFGLSFQMRRAVVSVHSNVADGAA